MNRQDVIDSLSFNITNKNSEKMEMVFDRVNEYSFAKRLIRQLKIDLRWINSDLGIFTNLKYL